MSLLQTAALVGSLAASAYAHGTVKGIVAAGTYYEGYNANFQYMDPAPIVIGWSIPQDQGNGFIAPDAYGTSDIICHLGATPAGTAAKVAAGDVVELQWTPWPSSHHGPVIDYLAKCDGSCSTVDKTTLEFFKIDEVGLVDDTTVPGTWASDQLIANNNSWTVTIPTDIAPGNYVLRHEIIALHSAGQEDGAQNYPQCINLEVTSSGTATPAGTLGEKLYNEDAAGIVVNIYSSLATYSIPGPTLYSGAVSMKQTEVAIKSTAPVATGSSTSWVASTYTSSSSAAAVTTSAAAASTPSTTSVAVATSQVSSAQAATSAVSSKVPVAVTSSTAAPVTSTIQETVTAPASYSSSSAAAAAESSAAPAAESSVAAPIASIASAVGTGALTQTIPTALPTGSAYPSGGFGGNSSWGGEPTKPLPAGFTLKDLLQWLEYLLRQDSPKQSRDHQRDFKAQGPQ